MNETRQSARPAQQRGGHSRPQWLAMQKGRKATLYLIRMTGNGETFYKVGITFDFSARFTRFNLPYQVRTLARYSSYNAGCIYDLERDILSRLDQIKYTPKLDFKGATECLSSFDEALSMMPEETFKLKHLANEQSR